MNKIFGKLADNKSGFTLTEVMIGIMILTVAIVAASNLLVGLINTNKTNVKTLQAYYFAQEGVELVRNIRDTNWLHNVGFKESGIGEGELALKKGRSYAISVLAQGWRNSNLTTVVQSKQDLNSYFPWEITEVDLGSAVDGAFDGDFAISLNEDGRELFFSGGANADTEFYRHIDILDACESDLTHMEANPTLGGDAGDDCAAFVLVRSVVNWKQGGREKEVSLETLLSNWKGGAL